MRLCIIGNSHVGALKRSWDNKFESDFKNKLDITFFASRGLGLNGLELNSNSLFPSNKKLEDDLIFTSNGRSSIDLNQYDVFLIYGAEAKPYYTSNDFYSDAVLIQSINDSYKSRLFFKILRQIRDAVDKKIFIGHNPLPANKNTDSIDLDMRLSKQYNLGISLVNSKLFSNLNAELVEQPVSTLSGNRRNTHSNFSKNSKRLDVGDKHDSKIHPGNDNGHMNDEYGRIWLETFVNKLNCHQNSPR